MNEKQLKALSKTKLIRIIGDLSDEDALCSNCLHDFKDIKDKPCNTCLPNKGQWEPKWINEK